METLLRKLFLTAMACVALTLSADCATKNKNGVKEVAALYKLKPDDSAIIRLDTATGREEHVKTVDGDGNIEMPFTGKIKIAGLTTTQAEEAIHGIYVPRFCNFLAVSVILQTADESLAGTIQLVW